MIFAFWHRSPPFRDQYIFLLGFTLPIYAARWIVHQRLFTHTLLDITFLIFVALSVYNFNNAPLSRADYWVLLCRPFLGILIIYYFVESVRQNGQLRHLISVTIGLGILIGVLALVASQWAASDKSDLFAFIIDALPVLDYRQVLPDMQLSFNPNEIAGALAYFCPFALGIALHGMFTESPVITTRLDRLNHWIIRWGSIICFVIIASALMLGQSRFALFGVFWGTFIVILFVLPKWTYRLPALGIWVIMLLLEVMIVTNVLPLNTSDNTTAVVTDASSPLDERDERTLTSRFDLWESALHMVQDYPTTGAGMSTYRGLIMQDRYITPLYEGRQFGPPHAHNVFFQFGADFGVMGFVLFLAWVGISVWMAYQAFQRSNASFRIMTISITSGILAYMGYGIGDAITLWDRFAFLHWWFMGLIVCSYILTKTSTHKGTS